jgi:hypothetical protein
MPRAIKFSKEREEELLRWIEDLYLETKSDWQSWMNNLPRWARAYRGIVSPKTSPWEGCSNLFLPLTPMAVERTDSALLGVIDQPDGLFSVLPQEGTDVASAENTQDFLNWACFSEINAHQAYRRASHKTVMYGRCPMVVLWRREQNRTRECWPVTLSEIGRSRDVRKVAQYFFQGKERAIHVSGGEALVDYVDHGRARKAKITILDDEDRVDPAEDELEFEVEQTVVTRDCPTLEIPAPEDLLASADGQTPDDAECHFYNLWVSLSQLENQVAQKYYKLEPSVLTELREQYAKRQTADESELASPTRSFQETYSSVMATSARRRNRFLVQKCFARYDADGDGNQEECVFSVLYTADSKKHLLRAEYLEQLCPSKYSKRPIVFSDFIFIDDIPSAIGVPEYIRAVQAEMNALHNQIVDANQIRNTPFFLYRAGSSLAPGKLRISPGQGIPVDDPASVRFPAWPSSSASDFMTVQFLMDLYERSIPTGDVAMGRGSGGNRTAGGMAMLVQQNREIWDKFLRNYGEAIEATGRLFTEYYGANMTAYKEFRVTGSNALKRITREDLRAGYDFRVRTSSLLTNKEIQRSYAALRFQMLAGHPLFQSEARQYALVRDLLKSQEKKDWIQLVGPEPEETRHPQIGPDRENLLFVHGIAFEPHPGEDYEFHLNAHQNFLGMAAEEPNTTRLLLQHIDHTQRLMGEAQRLAQQKAMGIPQGAEITPDYGLAGGALPMANSLQQQPQALLEAQQMPQEAP